MIRHKTFDNAKVMKKCYKWSPLGRESVFFNKKNVDEIIDSIKLYPIEIKGRVKKIPIFVCRQKSVNCWRK